MTYRGAVVPGPPHTRESGSLPAIFNSEFRNFLEKFRMSTGYTKIKTSITEPQQ
jgi:hypothetical protein